MIRYLLALVVAFLLLTLGYALGLTAAAAQTIRPANWEAGIGIVQEVRTASIHGAPTVSLVYSDGRQVVVDGNTLIGPAARPEYRADPDQILSIEDVVEGDPQ